MWALPGKGVLFGSCPTRTYPLPLDLFKDQLRSTCSCDQCVNFERGGRLSLTLIVLQSLVESSPSPYPVTLALHESLDPCAVRIFGLRFVSSNIARPARGTC